MLDVLLYRLHRTRRVIVLGLVPTLATLWVLSYFYGFYHPYALAVALFVPTAHALRYPNNWTETLTVSLVTAVCLALASTISPVITSGDFAIRLFFLCLLWVILFFVLVSPLAMLGTAGPISTAPLAGVASSRLATGDLKQAITYFPGRTDDCAICGEADEDGRFSIKTRLEFDVLTYEDTASDDLQSLGMSPDGVIECEAHAIVHASGADHHEIFYFDPSTEAVTVSKHTFQAQSGGTRVVLQEAGAPLSTGERFGIWLSDFIADHLTDQIDRAEQRAPRANRAFRHKQFVVDLANLIMPLLADQCQDEPKDGRH